MIWIHPGGYGLQDGTQDMSEILNANNNGFIAVAIQYRVRISPWDGCSALLAVPGDADSELACVAGRLWVPVVCRGQKQRCRQRGSP